jgi:hypothetical protein
MTALKQRLAPEDYDRAGRLMRNFLDVFAETKKHMPSPQTEVFLQAGLYEGLMLTGHIDLLQMKPTEAFLIDYKTGRQHEDHFQQMAGYAYLVWTRAGGEGPPPEKFTVYASVVYLEDKAITSYEFDVPRLRAWLEEVRLQVDAVRYTAGRKCAGCRLQGSCPAYRDYAKGAVAVFTDDFTVGDSVWDALTPDERGELMDRIYVVEKAADRVKLALRNHVRKHGPLDVGGNKEYTVVEEKIEFLDPAKARQVLVKVLPPSILNRLCRINLDEALTAYQNRAAKGTKTDARKKLYATLDKAGAIVRSATSRMWRRQKGDRKMI